MDNRSTCSTGSISASNRKVDCPFCNEEFQNRYLFNHIQKKHQREFVEHIFIDGVEDLQMHIDMCWGVPLMWKVKNDFGEDEEVEINGCLGCGTGIPYKGNATTHCAKDKCRAKHIQGLQSLMTPIKRKEKAIKEEKAKNDPNNWTSEVLEQQVEIAMRRYKYMAAHVVRLVETYNKYIRLGGDSTKPPVTFEPEPITYDKENIRIEYHRWIKTNLEMDILIFRLREAMFYNLEFNYELWMPRNKDEPTRIFVITANMHYPENIEIYPSL
jgi:hypothetical protein